MNITILGATSFIGINLIIELAKDEENFITLFDLNEEFFVPINKLSLKNVRIICSEYNINTDFETILKGTDVVYHLISTTVPTTSNKKISEELSSNIIVTTKILEACVKCSVKKFIFMSSGGTVYGKEGICPLKEDTLTNPISSYGVQKLTIEKLLYIYEYLYNLDYKIIRLANPYGPFQRPNGIQGVITTFVYKALTNQKINVFGDGSVVRDFIYIDDAVRAIINISKDDSEIKLFNLGSGYGISIKEILDNIGQALDVSLDVEYSENRSVDIPVNYLDISRYEGVFGKLSPISIKEGILKTADFMKKYYL